MTSAFIKSFEGFDSESQSFQVAGLLNCYPIFPRSLFFLTPLSFPSISYFFLPSSRRVSFFFIPRTLSHVRFFFFLPFPRKLVSCFQFCAGLRKGSAEQHSFVSSTLSSAPSKLSYPELPQLFFSPLLRYPSILFSSSPTTDRRETYSVSVSIAFA